MTRILMVIQRLWQGGGTETHVISLATHLMRRGHSVGIYTSGGAWTRLAESLGIRLHVPPYQEFDTANLSSVIHKHGYQIVHVHDGRSLALVGRLRTPRPRIVFTVHGLYVGRATIGQSASIASAVLAVSPAIGHYVQKCGVPLSKIHIVPNGIAMDQFRPSSHHTLRSRYGIPPHAFVIGYAGRFTFDKVRTGKRIARVLSAYANTQGQVYVLIAGRNSSRSVPAARHVHVIGYTSTMPRFYNSCNLLIGTGRVALESLSCNIPTIAIGHSKYFGLVTTKNLKRAIDTNFGDHISSGKPWPSSALLRDVQRVHHSRHQVRRETASVHHIVRRWLSVDHMVQRTLRAYRL